MTIFAEVPENEFINERHALLKEDNLTNTLRDDTRMLVLFVKWHNLRDFDWY